MQCTTLSDNNAYKTKEVSLRREKTMEAASGRGRTLLVWVAGDVFDGRESHNITEGMGQEGSHDVT